MRSAAALSLTLVLLQALVGQVNHAISGMHLFVFAGGLFITFGALWLPLRSGLAASVFSGLLLDSVSPLPFGTHALLFATAHVAILKLRDRLPRDELATRLTVALIANLGLFIALSLMQAGRLAGFSSWPRLVCDLAGSELAVALLAPWFFALQGLTVAAVAPESIRAA